MGLKIKNPFRKRLRLPKISIPNPVDVAREVAKTAGDVVGGVARTAGDVVGGVAKGAGDVVKGVTDEAAKAIGEAVKIPERVAKELERGIVSITDELSRTREQASKNVTKAIRDTVDAAKAVGRFVDRQRLDAFETAEGAMHQKDVFTSVWYTATTPIKNTNKNAMRAVQESEVLAAAASVAATAYGGPAGAAAYAAWMAYNVTGDINLALRVGVTQGLVAAATGAVSKMPIGPERTAAEMALKVAISKAQGAESEDLAQLALASLVQTASAHVSATMTTEQFHPTQEAVITGVMGGAAIAASGGNSEEVRSAFLKSGGSVLVQGLRERGQELGERAESEAKSFVTRVIGKDKLAEIEKAYSDAKQGFESEVAAVTEARRAALEPIVAAAKQVSNSVVEEVGAKRKAIQVRIDVARARAIQARALATSRATKVEEAAIGAYASLKVQMEKEIAAGKRLPADIELEMKKAVDKIEEDANAALVTIYEETSKVMTEADRVVRDGVRNLAEFRSYAINQFMNEGGERCAAFAMSNDWVLSWDAGKLRSGNASEIAVVMTFTGEGSSTAEQVDDLDEDLSEPDELESLKKIDLNGH